MGEPHHVLCGQRVRCGRDPLIHHTWPSHKPESNRDQQARAHRHKGSEHHSFSTVSVQLNNVQCLWWHSTDWHAEWTLPLPEDVISFVHPWQLIVQYMILLQCLSFMLVYSNHSSYYWNYGMCWSYTDSLLSTYAMANMYITLMNGFILVQV